MVSRNDYTMDLYKASLASLVVANGGLGYLQYRSVNKGNLGSSSVELEYAEVDNGKERDSEPADDAKTVWHFKIIFMSVYALVMGADWLQVRGGPSRTRNKPFDRLANDDIRRDHISTLCIRMKDSSRNKWSRRFSLWASSVPASALRSSGHLQTNVS